MPSQNLTPLNCCYKAQAVGNDRDGRLRIENSEPLDATAGSTRDQEPQLREAKIPRPKRPRRPATRVIGVSFWPRQEPK